MAQGVRLIIPTVFADSSLPNIPVSPAVLASDSFDRANSTLLGNTDSYIGGTARAWEYAAQLEIISNRLGGPGLTTNRFPTVDVGRSNQRVTVRYAVAPAGGVVVRASDAATPECYLLYTTSAGLQIGYIKNGSTTILAQTGIMPAAGDTISLSAQGTTIVAYRNDVEIARVTDNNITTGNRAGIRTGNATQTDARYDNWLATAY